jgi:mRNA guanylyltransferase
MQPVSLSKDTLSLLSTQDYYVCEKSDGIRIFCFIAHHADSINGGSGSIPAVYLCDRHYEFRELKGFFWPFSASGEDLLLHSHTLLDGELVIDRNPYTQEQVE